MRKKADKVELRAADNGWVVRYLCLVRIKHVDLVFEDIDAALAEIKRLVTTPPEPKKQRLLNWLPAKPK